MGSYQATTAVMGWWWFGFLPPDRFSGVTKECSQLKQSLSTDRNIQLKQYIFVSIVLMMIYCFKTKNAPNLRWFIIEIMIQIAWLGFWALACSNLVHPNNWSLDSGLVYLSATILFSTLANAPKQLPVKYHSVCFSFITMLVMPQIRESETGPWWNRCMTGFSGRHYMVPSLADAPKQFKYPIAPASGLALSLQRWQWIPQIRETGFWWKQSMRWQSKNG